jgi:NADH-quinone oxidoreductase subunit N
LLWWVVGAFFFLRMVKLMFFDEPGDAITIGGSTLMRAILSVNALLAFGLGVIPGTLLELCQRALQ